MKTAKHAQLHGILKDFIRSEQRIREITRDIDRWGLLRDYLSGLAILCGIGLAAWLLWSISGGLVEALL